MTWKIWTIVASMMLLSGATFAQQPQPPQTPQVPQARPNYTAQGVGLAMQQLQASLGAYQEMVAGMLGERDRRIKMLETQCGDKCKEADTPAAEAPKAP